MGPLIGDRMLQRTLPAGFIAPCLPTKTDKLPSGSQWLHEIKRDGFRVIARKKAPRWFYFLSARIRIRARFWLQRYGMEFSRTRIFVCHRTRVLA
jgi:hypothetical protein